MSRTRKSLRNLVAGTGGEILRILLKFVARTVFIAVFNVKLLGLNGLFANILTVFSLAELGVGTAVMFEMYKPLAEQDMAKIRAILAYYHKLFRIIGGFILLAGLALLPFLDRLVKEDVDFVNIRLVFLLFLLQSVSTYLFGAYKQSIIRASQMGYVVETGDFLFAALTHLSQIVILLVTGNFYLYLGIEIVLTILKNLYLALQADRLHPEIRGKATTRLSKSERKSFWANSLSILIYKANRVVMNATDNIILSSFIGLTIVGLYSNYLLIVGVFKSILGSFSNAFSASLGNLYASQDTDKTDYLYKLFNSINLMITLLYGTAAVGTFVASNRFITLWIGEDYVLGPVTVLLLAIEIYLYGIVKSMNVYRSAFGLFVQARFRPILAAVLNLGLSLALVRPLQINGVLLGTIISTTVVFLWIDPIIIHRHVLRRSPGPFYLSNFIQLTFIATAGGLSYLLTSLYKARSGWQYLLADIGISLLVTGLLAGLFFWKSNELRFLVSVFNKHVRKI